MDLDNSLVLNRLNSESACNEAFTWRSCIMTQGVKTVANRLTMSSHRRD
jgi:hypothetical protein